MAETTADQKRTPLPKSIEDVQAITHVPTTPATASFARFVNKYLTNADNFDGITEEQAWTVIGVHRVWQQSEERKAEIEQEKAEAEKAKAAEKERKAAEKAEKERIAAEKKAEKERKAAERAAKKAAEDGSADDLDEVDEEGSGPIETPKRKRRPRAKAAEEATEAPAPEAEETVAL